MKKTSIAVADLWESKGDRLTPRNKESSDAFFFCSPGVIRKETNKEHRQQHIEDKEKKKRSHGSFRETSHKVLNTGRCAHLKAAGPRRCVQLCRGRHQG